MACLVSSPGRSGPLSTPAEEEKEGVAIQSHRLHGLLKAFVGRDVYSNILRNDSATTKTPSNADYILKAIYLQLRHKYHRHEVRSIPLPLQECLYTPIIMARRVASHSTTVRHITPFKKAGIMFNFFKSWQNPNFCSVTTQLLRSRI